MKIRVFLILKTTIHEHIGDISIFGDKNFQNKVVNLYDELEKYPEFINEKSFDAIYLKQVRCVEKDGQALLEMNRMLKIILSMIAVKKEYLKVKIDEIVKKNTSNDKLIKPHFAIQLWGPKFTDFDLKESTNSKEFDESSFYTYQHSNDEDCPAYFDKSKLLHHEPHDKNGQVIYPCNVGGCGKPCDCEICNMWAGDEIVNCPDHHPDHPRMFDPENDIIIRRRIFFNANQSPKFERPRANSFWRPYNIELAGMKRWCLICQKIVKDHLKNHHSLKLHSEYCQICGHLEIISENSMALCCFICLKRFQSQYRLKDHMNTHNQDNTFSCETCGKTFPTKFTEKRHINEVHNKEHSEYHCDLCSSTFSLERNLQRHITIVHTGEPSKYSCIICDKTFSRKDNLNQHNKEVHSIDTTKLILKGINDSQSSFQCLQCESSFTRRNMLKRHMETVHTTSYSTFVCATCDKSFSRNDKLKRHQATVHEQVDTIFSCEKCLQQFYRKDNLKRHEQNNCYEEK